MSARAQANCRLSVTRNTVPAGFIGTLAVTTVPERDAESAPPITATPIGARASW
jgi:hypothetical protein